MDVSALTTAIATVGFPIVACAALFWQNWKVNENHKKEMEKITEAVNNNTIAITNLSNRINNFGGKNDE